MGRSWTAPSTSFAGPPPRAGEEFSARAIRLAGQVCLGLGWTPDSFWAATPADLAMLVAPADGAEDALGRDQLTRMMEAHPDG